MHDEDGAVSKDAAPFFMARGARILSGKNMKYHQASPPDICFNALVMSHDWF